MIYNSNLKRIDNKIDLTISEAKILETLLKYNGRPITLYKIVEEIHIDSKFKHIEEGSIRVYTAKLNKKIGGIIKNKRCFGYYIEEEIKIY